MLNTFWMHLTFNVSIIKMMKEKRKIRSFSFAIQQKGRKSHPSPFTKLFQFTIWREIHVFFLWSLTKFFLKLQFCCVSTFSCLWGFTWFLKISSSFATFSYVTVAQYSFEYLTEFELELLHCRHNKVLVDHSITRNVDRIERKIYTKNIWLCAWTAWYCT